MNYKNVDIKMEESPKYVNSDYTVVGIDQIVYKASCVYGNAFALEPQTALDMVKLLIDQKK